jgi:subtilisin family serine protease
MKLAAHTKPVAIIAAFAVLLLLVIMGAREVTAQLRSTPDEDASPFSIVVDASVAAPVPELPQLEGAVRPVASVVDDDGVQAEFVENELILTTDDEAQLAAFLARWNGKVLATLDPTEYELDGLGAQHLVRMDASAADPTTLAQLLDPVDRDAGGAHRVSSDAGLRLLTAVAREAAAGLAVELNLVARPQDFRARVSDEAPTASPLYLDRYPGPNAFSWPSHSSGSEQDIGVAEAWRALDLANRLDNPVTIAILDAGFRVDDDTPPGWRAVSVEPAVEPVGTRGWGADPWHGHRAVNAAMAAADNDFGGAGPGGPVAEPLMVRHGPDVFGTISGLAEARRMGADIVNMSFGVVVSGKVSGFMADSLRAMISSLRQSNVLVFAAAGNANLDVDRQRCFARFFLCRDRVTVVPCEFSGVICVGGLAWDSKLRHPDSNYGGKDVDIFAPFEVWMAVGPSDDPNQAGLIAGTSFSAPFVAGVAALVWAADPDLSADEVESILTETAHASPDDTVGRYVNALGAVRAATNVPPELTVHHPDDGAEVQLNVPVTFQATAHDYEDGEYCCTISWQVRNFTGIRIPMGSGQRASRTFTAEGAYAIEVTARDSSGRTDSATLTVEAVNTPPVVQITRPSSGESVSPATPYLVRATAADPNEPGGRLDCDRLRWTSSVAADPFPLTGCSAEVTFPTAGPRTLTVTATDSHGADGTATVQLGTGGAPPEPGGPTVRILSPSDGSTIANDPGGLLALDWRATDPAAGGLDHSWSVSYPYDPAAGTAGATETINAREVLYPHPWIAWLPFDNLGEDYCELDGSRVRVTLEVTDAAGRTGTDFVLLRTETCIIVE